MAYIEGQKHFRQHAPGPRASPLGTEHLLLGQISPATQADMTVLRGYAVFYAEVAHIMRRLKLGRQLNPQQDVKP